MTGQLAWLRDNSIIEDGEGCLLSPFQTKSKDERLSEWLWVCVCMCVWERESEIVRESVCVRESVFEKVCVRDCVWESMCEIVCV